MLHGYLGDAKFWRILLRIDEELAEEVRSVGGPHCRSVLHSARYPRKPRGVGRGVLDCDYGYRLSLCCAAQGCRRRATPSSVRFLGRRVYLGAMVVLHSALSQGLTTRRLEGLRERFGVSPRTVGRWRRWWCEVFAVSRLWCGARGDFMPAPRAAELPGGLLARMGGGDGEQALIATLRFICAVTVG